MPYYQSYVFTSANQMVLDLAAFAEANGWTIDLNAAYLTSYRRLHLHKGSAHFELRSYSATGIYLSGCTGYGGTSPATAPGYCGRENVIANTVGATYSFVSTVSGLYFHNAQAGPYWGGLFTVAAKVGAWTEGFGFQAAGTAGKLFGVTACLTTNGGAQLYYNGAWSPVSAAVALANSLVGNFQASNWTIPVANQPSMYNGGLMPSPILLMLASPLDTAKRIPLGFAPGLLATSGGTIYSPWDELVIGADTYVITPSSGQSALGSTAGDQLFKLGA